MSGLAGVPVPGHRPDIDGLRAVAVLSVLLFHLKIPGFDGGFVGVDVFFVISGFLITRLVVEARRRGDFTFAGFYVRRMRRLFPALFATLLLTFVATAALLGPSKVELVGRTTLSALLSVSNFQFWQEIDYFDPQSKLNPLLHTWSLSVEEQFYLLWPAALVLLTRWRTAWQVAAVATVFAVGLGASEWAAREEEMAAFYLLPFRMFELALGALMVWLVRVRPRDERVLEPVAVLGLAMVLWPVFSYSEGMRFPGLNALLPCAGTALLVYSGTARRVGLLLRNPVATWIGAISYSLYLVHWPLIIVYELWKLEPPTMDERIVIGVVSIAVAGLFYRFIETPFRRLPTPVPVEPGQPTPWPNRRYVLGSVALAVVLMVPSLQAWATRGRVFVGADADVLTGLMEGRVEVAAPRNKAKEPRFRVAVTGDSHANRVILGLREWGNANNIEVGDFYATPGCPPLYEVFVAANPAQARICRKRKDRMLQKIIRKDFDAVVLVGRWGLYVGDLVPSEDMTARSISMDPKAGHHQSQTLSRAAFTEGLERTVDLFGKAGMPVIFLGQNPPIGPDPYPCVERQRTIADVQAKCVRASYEEMLAETQWAIEEAKRVAAGRPNLIVVDPFETFCRKGRCMLLKDGRMLYSDGNHLNMQGSRMLAKRQLGPAIVTLMRSGPAPSPETGIADIGTPAAPEHAAQAQ
jgi:peptidoglycan/LPS O-acetylase OafA/YrhL